MSTLALTTFNDNLSYGEILRLDYQYEITKTKALEIRNMPDSDVIDAVFKEIQDKPVYFENPDAVIDFEKLIAWKKRSDKAERKKDQKDLRLGLKEIKQNTSRSSFFKDVFSNNSKNFIKACFIGFVRGFSYSRKKRQERIMRKELTRALGKAYREKEKLRASETTKLKEEKWKEALKNSNAPYTSTVAIPRFSAKYEGLDHIERLANRLARKEMEKWLKDYQWKKRPDKPLVKDFIELRDIKFKQLYIEKQSKDIAAEHKLNASKKQFSTETSNMDKEIEKLTHPTQHIGR